MGRFNGKSVNRSLKSSQSYWHKWNELNSLKWMIMSHLVLWFSANHFNYVKTWCTAHWTIPSFCHGKFPQCSLCCQNLLEHSLNDRGLRSNAIPNRNLSIILLRQQKHGSETFGKIIAPSVLSTRPSLNITEHNIVHHFSVW